MRLRRSGSFLARCYVLATLAAALSRPTAGRAEERVDRYPDGARQRAYAVDAEGRRNGAFKEFYPNGKLKVQAVYRKDQLQGTLKQFDADGKLELQENYRAGKLHGARQEYSKGRMVRDEFWLDGDLLIPQSLVLLAVRLKEIADLPVKTVGSPPKAYPKVEAALKDPKLQAEREAALRALMAYRCVCGLPYRDLKLDWTCIAHAEAASDLLTRLNKMTHAPENPGLLEDDYRLGATGAACSNLFSSTGMVDAVKSFMNDSDGGNIDRLGHRRWCLNPAMGKTGFGACGKFTAMWSMDGSNADVPDYDCIAFPPRGFTPVKSFGDGFAWSVSLNPGKYQPPQRDRVKVGIIPARFRPRPGVIDKLGPPLELNYFNVNLDGFGIPNCVIFRPANFKVVPGAVYRVEITGLSTFDGQDAKLEYLVVFAAM